MSANQKQGLVVFEVAGVLCALPLEDVREIVLLPMLFHPPTSPSILAGFLNLGGQIVPVVFLSRLLALSSRPQGMYTHVLVLEEGGAPLGLLVDYARETVERSGGFFLPVEREHSLNDCAEAEAVLNGKSLYLLSSKKLLLEEERVRISELKAMEQERLSQLQGS